MKTSVMTIKVIGPNQTELHIGSNVILFSYMTPVAARWDGMIFRSAVKYSNTTSRHINAWLDASRAVPVEPAFFTTLLTVGFTSETKES